MPMNTLAFSLVGNSVVAWCFLRLQEAFQLSQFFKIFETFPLVSLSLLTIWNIENVALFKIKIYINTISCLPELVFVSISNCLFTVNLFFARTLFVYTNLKSVPVLEFVT